MSGRGQCWICPAFFNPDFGIDVQLCVWWNWIVWVIEWYKEEQWTCMTFGKKFLTVWLHKMMRQNHAECVRVGRSTGCKPLQQLNNLSCILGQFLKCVVNNTEISLISMILDLKKISKEFRQKMDKPSKISYCLYFLSICYYPSSISTS